MAGLQKNIELYEKKEMKNLVIIGAGGMGRTIYDIALESVGFETEYVVKGFLDDDLHALDNFSGYPPILGTVDDYEICENDVFTWSIGSVSNKKNCCEKIIRRGGEFITLIHNTARIGSNVKVGKGSIVAAYVSVGADAEIGQNVLVQAYSVIAHDVKVGDWSRIDTHVVCVGGTVVGKESTIYTNSVINHKVVVEDNATVAACSFVIKRVKSGTTVYGNPAKRLI